MLAIQLRFRERRVALQSDIEAMFMQVKGRTVDRQFLQFLWIKEISSVPDVFEYERHIFEARDSPTCANYNVRKYAEDQQKKYPDAIKQVQANFYMDDYVASFDTIDEAASVQQTISRLELQAAVYAIRMRRTICNETTFNIVDVHHWSDSSSVLHWISNTHERHKIFIANRLSEILDHSKRSG